jgi:hypothetical protein
MVDTSGHSKDVEMGEMDGDAASSHGSSGAGSSSQAWSMDAAGSSSLLRAGLGLVQRLGYDVNAVKVGKRPLFVALAVLELLQWATLPFEVAIAKAPGMAAVGRWAAVIRAPMLGDKASGIANWCIFGVLVVLCMITGFECARVKRGISRSPKRVLKAFKWFSVLHPVLLFPAFNICARGSLHLFTIAQTLASTNPLRSQRLQPQSSSTSLRSQSKSCSL